MRPSAVQARKLAVEGLRPYDAFGRIREAPAEPIRERSELIPRDPPGPSLYRERSEPYILSATAWPNAEQETSVASSMSLAKSYVTIFSSMAASMPLTIRSAASFHPM